MRERKKEREVDRGRWREIKERDRERERYGVIKIKTIIALITAHILGISRARCLKCALCLTAGRTQK